MNPNTNRFEKVGLVNPEDMARAYREQLDAMKHMTGSLRDVPSLLPPSPSTDAGLYRPDGSPVPATWSVFTVGEIVIIKDYTFKVAYVGETSILFEPVGPVLIGQKD